MIEISSNAYYFGWITVVTRSPSSRHEQRKPPDLPRYAARYVTSPTLIRVAWTPSSLRSVASRPGPPATGNRSQECVTPNLSSGLLPDHDPLDRVIEQAW